MDGAWDPSQYERFARERQEPLRDLLELCRAAPGARAVDLGCGTGAGTRALHERLGARETLGIDDSETMLSQAAPEGAPEGDGVHFELADLRAALEPGGGAPWDVVFSNAALHWIDDHPALFARLAEALRPGGQLAVQVPANHDSAAYGAADALVAEEPFRSELGGWARRSPVLAPEHYARLLDRLGFREPVVLLRVYVHHLESREAVLEWMAGTYLKPYQARLSPASWAGFRETLAERLRAVLADERPYSYPFKRLFLWAAR